MMKRRRVRSSAPPSSPRTTGAISTQSAIAVVKPITSVLQRRRWPMFRHGEAHVVGVVGIERLVGAKRENDQEREHRKADHDGGEDQRLRQWIGKWPR